jgi:hypothetical protein
MWCPFCRSSYEESGMWVWRMGPYISHQTRTSSLWPPPSCRRGPSVYTSFCWDFVTVQDIGGD